MLSDTKQKRIVVAEDDPAIRELVCLRLDLAGYHAIPANDGYKALERINASRPAALVLDIGMPKLDGFAVLRELQRRMPGLPVLILTARRAKEDVSKAIGMGAHSYLVKPFDERQLLDRIERMIAPPSPNSTPTASYEVWEV